jgi:hypothetical protein
LLAAVSREARLRPAHRQPASRGRDLEREHPFPVPPTMVLEKIFGKSKKKKRA